MHLFKALFLHSLLVASCLPVLICGIVCVSVAIHASLGLQRLACASVLSMLLSWHVGLVCVCVCVRGSHVSRKHTDFSSSSVSCGWMQTIHFLAGGVLWAWTAVTRSSHPCFECEVWLAVSPGTTSLCAQSSAIALSWRRVTCVETNPLLLSAATSPAHSLLPPCLLVLP